MFVDIADLAERIAAPEAEVAGPTEKQMDEVLNHLTAGQRRVVRSIAVDGRSITETAAQFGMKEPAVRVAFHRGLMALAARFGRQS